MRRRLDDATFALIAAFVGAALAYLVIPIAVAVAMSFDARTFLGPFPPVEFSARWYVRFFTDTYMLKAIRTSIVIAILATAVSTVSGVAAALVLDRYRFRGHDVLASLFLAPLVVPAVVIGFSLLLLFSILGIYDGFVRLLGAHILITIPYTIRTTLAALVGIRKSVVEAALSLGANERQAFWSVTFPLARTGIVAGGVFAFAFSLDDVAVSLFLTDPTTYTLPVAMISMMRASFDLRIAAAAVLLVAFTVVLIFVLDRLVGLERIVGQGIYRA